MTSWAHTGYLVRYLKQFGYIKQRKTRNGKIHRHNKSLFISNKLHSVTRSGVLDYILKSTQYKQFPKKKKKEEKKKGTKEKDRKRSVIGRKEKKKEKGGQRIKTEKEEADEKAVEEERREKRKERRRKKIKRKTKRAAQKMHRPLRTHSLAKS